MCESFAGIFLQRGEKFMPRKGAFGQAFRESSDFAATNLRIKQTMPRNKARGQASR